MLCALQGMTLGQVFIAHRAQLRSVAKKIVGTAEVADEITQDAYLRLAEGHGTQQTVRQPLSYCCQVVRNIAIDHCRRRSFEAKIRVFTDDGEVPEMPVSASYEQRLDDRRLIAAIDSALGTLPERTRKAFELFRLGDLTQREIATRLGCSATLVNFMVKDAQRMLESLRTRRDLFGA